MISISNLNFGYKRRRMLFNNLDLQLSAGNIYGLLGRNGAGKTTLLKILCGMRFPNSGICRIIDYIPGERKSGLLQNLFIVPEQFTVPSFPIKMFEKLYASFYPKFSNELFMNYLKEFDLNTETKLTNLSFGQQKKFMLAFAFATNCQLLLLDEPTNGLDIPSKSQFRKILASFSSEDKVVIISTHQVKDVENLIDIIVVIDDGKIIFNQSLFDVMNRLCLKLLTNEPGKNEVIYSEKTLGGYAVITENTSNEQTSIELEFLFNSIISSSEKMSAVFRKEENSENKY